MNYKIGKSFSALTDAKTYFGAYPRSSFLPGGSRVTTFSGANKHTGYQRSTWTLFPVTLARWRKFRFDIESGYSGECWIETRDDQDTWFYARAIARLPEIDQLERFGLKYISVPIEFVILERWEMQTIFSCYILDEAADVITFSHSTAWKFYGVTTSAQTVGTATLAVSGGATVAAATIGSAATPVFHQPTVYPVDIDADETLTLTLATSSAARVAIKVEGIASV